MMIAVFLIVVLTALAAALATLSQTSHGEVHQSLLSAKVYYGAKAGLDWGIHQAIAAGNCAAAASFPLTQAGLADVSVTVTCARQDHGSAAAGNQVYVVVAIATITGASVGDLAYAERRVQATVSNIP